MPVKPLGPRYKLEDLGDKLVISMPSIKIWPFILVFIYWSFAWGVAEILLIFVIFGAKELDKFDIFSFVIIILLWTVLGALLIYHLAWQLFGKEEIQVTNQSITISRIVFRYKRSKEYLAEYIKDVGLAYVRMQDLIARRWSITQGSNLGSISFDYGARTFRFAGGLDEAEAKQIIAAMQQKYPQYKQ